LRTPRNMMQAIPKMECSHAILHAPLYRVTMNNELSSEYITHKVCFRRLGNLERHWKRLCLYQVLTRYVTLLTLRISFISRSLSLPGVAKGNKAGDITCVSAILQLFMKISFLIVEKFGNLAVQEKSPN